MPTATSEDLRFATPLYTVTEAARLLELGPSTLSTWVKGYQRQSGGRPVVGRPVISSLEPATPRGPTIPFVGLAEGMVLAAVRAAGVPLQRIRPALEQLARGLGVEHALASQKLYTDGAEILYDLSEHRRDLDPRPVRQLIVVRSGQGVFSEVVEQYLRRIHYGPDGYARLVRLPGYGTADVVADPERGFGQPIFAHGGSRVADVLGLFWAGEDLETVAAEYGVPRSQLEDALRVASRRAA